MKYRTLGRALFHRALDALLSARTLVPSAAGSVRVAPSPPPSLAGPPSAWPPAESRAIAPDTGVGGLCSTPDAFEDSDAAEVVAAPVPLASLSVSGSTRSEATTSGQHSPAAWLSTTGHVASEGTERRRTKNPDTSVVKSNLAEKRKPYEVASGKRQETGRERGGSDRCV